MFCCSSSKPLLPIEENYVVVVFFSKFLIHYKCGIEV